MLLCVLSFGIGLSPRGSRVAGFRLTGLKVAGLGYGAQGFGRAYRISVWVAGLRTETGSIA